MGTSSAPSYQTQPVWQSQGQPAGTVYPQRATGVGQSGVQAAVATGTQGYPVRTGFNEAAEPIPPGTPVGGGPAAPPVYDEGMAAYGDAFGNGGGPVCGPACGGCCDFGGCLPCRAFLYADGQYLFWAGKGDHVPALVTTGSTADPRPGSLDPTTGPGTTVLFGNSFLNTDMHSGFRTNIGLWLDPCQTWGIEGSYLFLGRTTDTSPHYDQTVLGANQVLARPYYDVSNTTNYGPAAFQVANTATGQTGSIDVNAWSQFQMVDVLFRQALAQQCNWRVEAVAGFRYADLSDNLIISDQTTTVGDLKVLSQTADMFSTSNEFYGGVLGLKAQVRRCQWTLEGLFDLGIGETSTTAKIFGTTANTQNLVPQPNSPGLLALNPGSLAPLTLRSNSLSVLPELGATVGYDLARNLRLTFGYSLLYLSTVARAGDQVSLDVNSNFLSVPPAKGTFGVPTNGLVLPRYTVQTTDYWAQGMNFGVDYRF
jgi:hypothetical protein